MTDRGVTRARDAVVALISPCVGDAERPWDAVEEELRRASAAPEPLPGLDPATGEVVLSFEDVRLPGVLPLVIRRRYRTGATCGRSFGAAWCSTLDQRLVLGERGVRLVAEDGRVLAYPIPSAAGPVLPASGPHWPLTWDGTPGGVMRVTRPGTGRTWHYRPVPGAPGAELPLAAVTDRNGNTVRFVRGEPAGPPAEIVHSGGYRVGVTAEGGRVTELRLLDEGDAPVLARYAYDDHGNLTAAEDGAGRAERWEYDADGRLVRQEDRSGLTWYRYTYDEAGRVTAGEGVDGLLSATVAYDATARTAAVTGPAPADGATTTYAFDERARLIAVTEAPRDAVTRREWDAHGRLLSLTDPLGRTTGWGYDERGSLVSVTYADGTSVAAERDEHGHLTAWTREDGARWEVARDDRGNPLRETDPRGAATVRTHDGRGAPASLTDALGALTRVEANAAGLPVAVTGPDGRTTRYERDTRGRVISVTGPGGDRATVAWGPAGEPSEVTFADGRTERWEHDADGRLTGWVNAAGHAVRCSLGPFGLPTGTGTGDGTGHGATLTHTYDAALRPTEVKDDRGNTWTFTYDAAGRLVEETGPDGRSVRHRYDAAGQRAGWTNGAGQRVSQTRDGRGRLVEQRSDTEIARYRYDAAGRLVSAANAETEVTRELDALGAVLSETCAGRTTRFAYDALGRRTERRTPSGTVTTWEYGAEGFLTGLVAGDRSFGFEYDERGRETARHLGRPGVTLRLAWDAAGRLGEQVLPGGRRRAFRYREDGFVTRVDDSAAGVTSYTRDAAGRPVSVDGPGGTEEFGYDADGGPAGRASGYRYDAQGRVVALGGGDRSLDWDGHDRLTDVVTRDGRHWHQVYDALGRRVAKQLLDDYGAVVEQTAYVWDGDLLAEEIAPDTTATTWHWTPDGTRPVAQSHAAPGGGTRCFALVTDPAGTPTELVNGHGGIAWERRASVWGEREEGPG
ncbi:DUF6531 domain-containing protein, partial [Streptomyces sp. SBT349]|uniref:DUF6531 domain-containing protein n=1 Tax=Streptomyces sp. SBT349 TaxID=1580539 RepID=UPI00066E7BBF